jgi:hypothetical protein
VHPSSATSTGRPSRVKAIVAVTPPGRRRSPPGGRRSRAARARR